MKPIRGGLRNISYKKQAALDLGTQLAAQEVQLLTYHAELQKNRETMVLTQERQRLVRDLHDGLGSQLVSAGALLKTGTDSVQKLNQLDALIQHALLDLRSLLDVFSSNPQNHQDEEGVTLLLAMLRHRLVPMLQTQGIACVWEPAILPADFLSSDNERLHLLRILQEACTNILKHAQATQVGLRTLVTDHQIVFELTDNGLGMDANLVQSPEHRGHGLANMAKRCTRLGAQLSIESSAQGTCVRILFMR